jgi:hypothetical protein
MPLSRRPSAIAAALIVAGSQPVVPQARGKAPPAARGPGSLGLIDGQAITFTSPQFVVHALWFKANDETGWAWPGSDEVYAVFSDMSPTSTDRTTAEYDNVDEGDTVNFTGDDTCMAPQPSCDRGMAELNVHFSFWESDWEAPLGFSHCLRPDSPGDGWRIRFGVCIDDDTIGRGEIIYSRDELVAMLPSVGSSREFTHVMDKDAGKYRFRYRITRLADVERSIVIHLPPLDPATPTITLEAEPYISGGERRVRLSWSGATTASIDIHRNGAKVATAPNNGDYRDTVPVGTYQYRVCDLNSTTACSALVSVTVT